MAELVNAVVVTCPGCGKSASVQVWSCGCQTLDWRPSSLGCEEGHYEIFGSRTRSCGGGYGSHRSH